MKSSLERFNIILSAVFLLSCGCQATEKNKPDRQATLLRFHIETNRDGSSHNFPVPISRAQPVMVNVERDAVLDEGFIEKAEVVDVDPHGGCAIKVVFDEAGRRRLQALTAAYKGRRLAVRALWTENRWLAAPLITRNINDGVFIFTPDATREESERIVTGLKNVVKKLKKPYTF